MYTVKYSELVHMAEMHSQARASSPYERIFYNIHSITYNYFSIKSCFVYLLEHIKYIMENYSKAYNSHFLVFYGIKALLSIQT